MWQRGGLPGGDEDMLDPDAAFAVRGGRVQDGDERPVIANGLDEPGPDRHRVERGVDAVGVQRADSGNQVVAAGQYFG